MLNKMAEKVHAGNQITTHQNHANHNYLSNSAFMSKTELRKTMELMQMEINQHTQSKAKLEKKVNELLKEIIYYQKLSSELLEEKNKEDIDLSTVYLKIAE